MAVREHKQAPEQILVETDFLFGLRESDSRHSKILHALKMHSDGKLAIKVLSSAVLEARSVLYSRGHEAKIIEEVFSVMAGMLVAYGVDEFVPVELSDVIIAERLRNDEKSLSFYDSLHAATSKRLNAKLLSSEGVYRRIGLEAIDLDDL